MASNGAAPSSSGPALHTTLMEAEVAHAVAHLKAARAHAAAAGQSLDHTALEFLDAHDAKAPTGAKVRRKKKAGAQKPTPDNIQSCRKFSGFSDRRR